MDILNGALSEEKVSFLVFKRVHVCVFCYMMSSLLVFLSCKAGFIQLDLSQSFAFIEVLDTSDGSAIRASIDLNCTAYGHYEYFPYAIGPVAAN